MVLARDGTSCKSSSFRGVCVSGKCEVVKHFGYPLARRIFVAVPAASQDALSSSASSPLDAMGFCSPPMLWINAGSAKGMAAAALMSLGATGREMLHLVRQEGTLGTALALSKFNLG